MKTGFIKMHGLGNDFVVIEQDIVLSPACIATWGDRRTGIGFDQMAIVGPSRTAGTDAFMRLFNNDGSEIGACGNATRCVAMRLSQKLGRADVVIETVAAVIRCHVTGERVAVDMGVPRLAWQEIPLKDSCDTNFVPLGLMGLDDPSAVSVGNPHAVFFVRDVAAVDLAAVGPLVENHTFFPEKTNVEFAQILSPEKIRMRVWERGAGITRACGTGACATVVAAVRRGLSARRVEVLLDGGTLEIEWRESDNHILMTGPATQVYVGQIELSS